MRTAFMISGLGLCLTVGGAWALTDDELIALRDGFAARRDEAFAALRGQPLVVRAVQPPLGAGRGRYARAYSYAVVDFAFRALWNDEQPAEVAAALTDYADFYLADRGVRNDRDSFYWPADVLCRILEFFGREGSLAAGRLPLAVELRLLEMMFVYAAENSRVDDRDEIVRLYADWHWGKGEARGFPPLPASAEVAVSGTWDVLESENHHIQKFSALWHFSKLLAAAPEYRDRAYDDGHLPADHHAAWTAYAIEYLAQRARKGLFVEAANNGYAAHTLKGIYNFLDFGEPELARRSAALLDLYYASYAQEQLGRVRGGGKSRVYPSGGDRSGQGQVAGYLHYYLKWGPQPPLAMELATVLTSRYRLPLVVMDLFLDATGRGVYEIRERCPGLAEGGLANPPHYRLRQDESGVLRYSYCTPEFILGLGLIAARPMHEWTLISSQNTWRGAIFAGDRDARIIPQLKAGASGNTYNQQWGVQRLGCQITAALPRPLSSGGTGEMRVWVSRRGLTNRRDDPASGWAFVDAAGAYAAVRPARGGYRWEPSDDAVKDGDWMVLEDGASPVIIELARASEYADAAAFEAAMAACQPTWDGPTLRYRSRAGHQFTFTPDTTAPPTVDGEPLDLTPPLVYDSPFIQSRWDSGEVTIQKGSRRLELVFGG